MVEKKIVNDYYRLPKIILLLARILHILSPYLASRLLLFFFTRPIRFRTPDRELEFLDESELSRTWVPELNKNLQIYHLRNEGGKILLVHGWNGRGSQFHHIAKECHNAGFDVTVFDLPGHGKSTSSRCSVPEVISCIDHLSGEIGPFDHVISHSIGSIAALNSVRGENDFKRQTGAFFNFARTDASLPAPKPGTFSTPPTAAQHFFHSAHGRAGAG